MFRFLMAGISILTSRIIKPTHKPKVKVLADTYPSEFLHAIGRLKDATLRARKCVLHFNYSNDLKFVSLYACLFLTRISTTGRIESQVEKFNKFRGLLPQYPSKPSRISARRLPGFVTDRWISRSPWLLAFDISNCTSSRKVVAGFPGLLAATLRLFRKLYLSGTSVSLPDLVVRLLLNPMFFCQRQNARSPA